MEHVEFIIHLKMLARVKPPKIDTSIGMNAVSPPPMMRSMPEEEYKALKRLQQTVEDYEF